MVLLVVLFKRITLWLAACTANRADVQHAFAEFNERATVEGGSGGTVQQVQVHGDAQHIIDRG